MLKAVKLVCGMNIGTQDITIIPILSLDEIHLGTRLGMDSHADTSCINKHAFIESIVEGMRVDAVPFDERIGKLRDLPIVNSIYAYDNPNKFRTIILRINHSIYTKYMKYALIFPN